MVAKRPATVGLVFLSCSLRSHRVDRVTLDTAWGFSG